MHFVANGLPCHVHYLHILWDSDDHPDGNVQHIAEHGLTVTDVECVLENPLHETTSRTTGKPCCFGYTPSGEFIIVLYELIDADSLYPITAYEVPEKRGFRAWKRKK